MNEETENIITPASHTQATNAIESSQDDTSDPHYVLKVEESVAVENSQLHHVEAALPPPPAAAPDSYTETTTVDEVTQDPNSSEVNIGDALSHVKPEGTAAPLPSSGHTATISQPMANTNEASLVAIGTVPSPLPITADAHIHLHHSSPTDADTEPTPLSVMRTATVPQPLAVQTPEESAQPLGSGNAENYSQVVTNDANSAALSQPLANQHTDAGVPHPLANTIPETPAGPVNEVQGTSVVQTHQNEVPQPIPNLQGQVGVPHPLAVASPEDSSQPHPPKTEEQENNQVSNASDGIHPPQSENEGNAQSSANGNENETNTSLPNSTDQVTQTVTPGMTNEATNDVSAQAAKAATEAAVAAAVAASVNVPVPVIPVTTTSTVPTDRDVIFGPGSTEHKTNLLLHDLIRLHRILWILHDKPTPQKEEDVEGMAGHIMALLKNGKALELAGLKDVPRPFMKSNGRFFKKEQEVWKEMDDAEVMKTVCTMIVEDFKIDDTFALVEAPFKDLKDWLVKKQNNASSLSPEFMPESKDAVLLRCVDYAGEKMYEQQGGNKTLFHLASQLVSSFTTSSPKRVEAALNIMKGMDDIEPDNTIVVSVADKDITTTKSTRFLVRMQREDLSISWDILDPATAAEFAVIFVFEVFLEKEIHTTHNVIPSDIVNLVPPGAEADNINLNPSTAPVREPTDHDVLFGRGGMTNSHPGNRRFRDIIALHRPDYIRAIKMDKPAVARKIVRAIRFGHPPGRFLKKHDDGMWYDVGDRTAAEKTSQGLRERSNAEKRQRSALREALRIRKQDMQEDSDAESANKKAKTEVGASVPDLTSLAPTLNYVGTNLPVPLSLNMKETAVPKPVAARRKSVPRDGRSTVPEVLNTEGLPPNAVDEEGNILVTDYDILCGRGGLTNHHKGNKRFRDIVALHRPDYVRAPKIQKPSVARVIVRAIRNGDPPGRFLKKDEKSGKWYDIGDKKAAEKTSQALREKTNEEREQFKGVPGTFGVLLPSPTYFATNIFPNPIAAIPMPTAETTHHGTVETKVVEQPIVEVPKQQQEETVEKVVQEQKEEAMKTTAEEHYQPSQVNQAQEIQPQVNQAQEIQPQVNQTQEIHQQVNQAQEIQPQVNQAQEIQPQVNQAQEIHQQVNQAQEIHQQVNQAQEIHQQVNQAQEIHQQVNQVQEIHQQENQPQEHQAQENQQDNIPMDAEPTKIEEMENTVLV